MSLILLVVVSAAVGMVLNGIGLMLVIGRFRRRWERRAVAIDRRARVEAEQFQRMGTDLRSRRPEF